jgi:polyisoprenoid-binding protein YceI
MLLSKVRYWLIIVPVLTALLAACAPAQTPTTMPAADTQAPAIEATAPDSAAPTATTAPLAATSSSASSSGTGKTYTLVPAKSEASYSVREQLAQRDLPSDAVGKTNAVSGSITVNPDGTVDSASSKFVVDVTKLQTDSSMRDGFVRRNVLQADQYPQVVFVPTEISGLPSPLPQSGSVSFKVTGNLTIRDVTRPVTWDVTGTINNGEASGTATTSFTFEDFNLNQPKVPIVLSLVDKITLNVTIAFQ